ncbi:hypothetical protein NPIL_10011 [Nephila pilipes]|uniref:Uncharacterized protein n=1 Tax=Nephila pilipes TaxID=299642 RepID=A0A8X6ULK1_NEPPI|nr:hypothetical protein NPIL_10011 [Nephila pilipes]
MLRIRIAGTDFADDKHVPSYDNNCEKNVIDITTQLRKMKELLVCYGEDCLRFFGEDTKRWDLPPPPNVI